MKILRVTNINALPKFAATTDQLVIFERAAPQEGEDFMSKLAGNALKLDGTVQKENAAQDIQNLLQTQIPTRLQDDPFYTTWITDMAEICSAFCQTLSNLAIRFRLGSVRGCKRYHIDNVPMRLLVTYQGVGTEWLPEAAANREVYENGGSNTEIVLDASAPQFMNTWDIAIFKGGPDGVLHRTPDAALTQPSILMRLDPIPYGDHTPNHL